MTTCKHKRYSVDVQEQTGYCIDCGAEGRMQFMVDGDSAEPELLAALQAVLRWIDDNCETTGFDAVEAQADAALAKAGAELFNTEVCGNERR
jgi:mono/diheme cytochrome c family protein